MPISEQLGDVEGIITVLVKTSRIRVAKGIDTQEAFDRVLQQIDSAA